MDAPFNEITLVVFHYGRNDKGLGLKKFQAILPQRQCRIFEIVIDYPINIIASFVQILGHANGIQFVPLFQVVEVIRSGKLFLAVLGQPVPWIVPQFVSGPKQVSSENVLLKAPSVLLIFFYLRLYRVFLYSFLFAFIHLTLFGNWKYIN